MLGEHISCDVIQIYLGYIPSPTFYTVCQKSKGTTIVKQSISVGRLRVYEMIAIIKAKRAVLSGVHAWTDKSASARAITEVDGPTVRTCKP